MKKILFALIVIALVGSPRPHKPFPTPYPFFENEALADTVSFNCQSEDISTGVVYDGLGATEVESRFSADQACELAQPPYDPSNPSPQMPCVDLDCTQTTTCYGSNCQ